MREATYGGAHQYDEWREATYGGAHQYRENTIYTSKMAPCEVGLILWKDWLVMA